MRNSQCSTRASSSSSWRPTYILGICSMFFYAYKTQIYMHSRLHNTWICLVCLFPTLIPSSHVLVELLPWSGGAEKCDMLSKLGLHAFNLLQTDTGVYDLTATGDGDKDTCKVETGLWFFTISMNLAFYPHYGVWISIGTFVWASGGETLP